MNMVKSAGEIRDNAEYRQIIRIDGDTYTASALAKLNIKLSIGEREHGGLHRISSIFQTVSLRDHIILKKVRAGEEGIEGFVVRENIMAKALDELAIELGMESILCRINATKSIPVAAGMGGGSSDAAAVLRLANRAFGFGMSLEELDKVARRVGNDVSFLLRGGRAHVEGGKEHEIRQMEVPDLYYLIAKPDMMLKTREMYEMHDKTGKSFTELARSLCPDTDKLMSIMGDGSIEHGVTGKGPTVFAGYKTYQECEVASMRVVGVMKYGQVFIERAVGEFINP